MTVARMGQVFQKWDQSARRVIDQAGLVPAIRAARPGGVNMILIGLSQPGWLAAGASGGHHITGSAMGIIAVLTGLLLLALQKVQTGDSEELVCCALMESSQ